MHKYLINLSLKCNDDAITAAVMMLLSLGLVLPQQVSAQIRTDGSVGPAAQTLGGPRYIIPETLGKLSGSNLFHSFQSFNLGSQESANFTTSTTGIANVISRVTGGSLSQINGKISLTAASGSPNFYFINPAGVTFGAGASIDVPGAFHVSTANYLKFPDGNFHADTKSTSTFSSSTPEAFGFLGNSRAAIVVKDKAELATQLEQPVSLVAGDIEINNAMVLTTGGGNIRIAAVGNGTKEIVFNGALPALNGALTTVNGGAIVATSGATPEITSVTTTPTTDTSQTPGTDQRGTDKVTRTTTVTTSDTKTTVIQASQPRNGGNITASAGDIIVDGKRNSSALTGIISSAVEGNTGNAGSLELAATGNLSIIDGGSVASNTYTSGNSGSVNVNAKNITIDSKGNTDYFTALSSTAFPESAGSAGAVNVIALGDLSLVNGGVIGSPTFSSGNAGAVKVTAGNLFIDGQANAQLPTGISSAAYKLSTGKAGSLAVTVFGKLSITNAGIIDTSTFSTGDAGSVFVTAGSIVIDGTGNNQALTGISSTAAEGSKGKAGSVEVTSLSDLFILSAGGIVSPTYTSGDAGSVKVTAANIVIDGQGNVAGITSAASSGSSGRAGSVDVTTTGKLTLTDGGIIDSSTSGIGNAGSVKVNTETIVIDGKGKNNLATGISSTAKEGSKGKAGSVEVTSLSDLFILNAGGIVSPTYTSGDAGSVKVTATNIVIDGQGNITGITSAAFPGSSGKAGSVDVTTTGKLALSDGGVVDSSTGGSGNAGSVKVSATKIQVEKKSGITSFALEGSSGNAGNIDVLSSESLSVRGGAIDSSTLASGNAGSVTISTAGNLTVSDGGRISSSTVSSGIAGSVNVTAANILVEGISGIIASAGDNSSGQTGNINISATDSLTLTGISKIAIENFATVPDLASAILPSANTNSRQTFAAAAAASALIPTLLTVSAPTITLNDSFISAKSTGNVAASNVVVNSARQLTLNSSSIATSANQGNGGSINVRGGNTVALNRSQITTSVAGTNGNGGDITVGTTGLILNNGFVQANTAARNASGGNVSIRVDTLVPSLGTLLVGGMTPVPYNPAVPGLNVIQAAAPTGLTGNIVVSSPTLNIAGSLVQLKYQIIDTGGLGRNPCQINRGSSLTQTGRGGFASSAARLLVAQPDTEAQAAFPNKTLHKTDAKTDTSYLRWHCQDG